MNTCTGLVTGQNIIYYNKAQEPEDLIHEMFMVIVALSENHIHTNSVMMHVTYPVTSCVLRLKQAYKLVLCWCIMAGIV